MNTFQKIFLMFIFGCIFVRTLIVIAIFKMPKEYLHYTSYIGLIIGFGFLYNFIFKKARGSTFNQIAWWNILSPIHAALYFTFAYLAYNENKYAYVPLLIDVTIGLISFIIYHYFVGSFKKLI